MDLWRIWRSRGHHLVKWTNRVDQLYKNTQREIHLWIMQKHIFYKIQFGCPQRQNKHSCDECNKMCCKKGALILHSNLAHRRKRFVCDVCKKEFKLKGNWKRHIDNKLISSCEYCSSIFCNIYDLKCHISSSHWSTSSSVMLFNIKINAFPQ